MIKRIIAVLLLTVLAVGGAGCMVFQKTNFQDRALHYMENKYGEKFTFVSSWGTGYADAGHQKILVRSESISEDILVECYEDVFSDNYLAYKYADQVTSTVDKAATSFFSQSWVHYEVVRQTLSAELPANADFSAYCADPYATISVNIAVPVSAFNEADVERFANTVADSGLRGLICFAVVKDDQFEQLTKEEFQLMVGNNRYQYYAVITIKDDGIVITPREVGF